jgi:hypothetical protein
MPKAEKPVWPEGFWEELNRMPLPDDFDVGPPLPDQHTWSDGFWEEMLRLAPEVEIEGPEPLPPSPHRDAVLDELGQD